MSLVEKFQVKCRVRNKKVRIFLAEVLGTFILAFTNIGTSMQGNEGAVGSPVGAGLGVGLGIFVSARASGGHINPAVTLAFAVQGRLGNGVGENVIMALVYISAQLVGAFTAAGFMTLVYFNKFSWDTMDHVEGTCLFATCAQEEYINNPFVMFFDQIMGGFILAITVLSTTDPKNANPPGMAPFIIGLSLTTILLSFGANAGGCCNPARDFAPRLLASMIFGKEAFTGNPGKNSSYFFWIPIVGPLIGGMLAGLVYMVFIMGHWEVDEKTDEVSVEKEEL